MKILIIIDSLGSGGAERSTEVLCDYLESNGISFELICLDEKKVGVQARMQEKNYKITFLNNGNFYNQAKNISQIIESGKFSLVHSILFRANLRTRFAKLFTSFIHLESLVNTTYSTERFADRQVNQLALKFYKFVDAKSARKGVDHFHSITETVKNHYVEEVGLNPSKITVIPRGRKPIITHYNQRPTENRKVRFINVGRHEFQKGQIYLLQGVKELKELGYEFHLSIFGRDGTVTPQLKSFIKENNLENFITLEGYSSNIPELLLNADVFAFSSLYEGLGGALIEAQAAGLPVICNDIPVLHEVVNENENARFFRVSDIGSIVDAFKYFIDHPDQRKTYGEKSLINYEKKFQESINNERLLGLYKKLEMR